MLQVSPASRVLGPVLGPPWPVVAQHDTSSNYYATSLSILMCIILLLYIMYSILSQLVYLKVLTSVGFFSATVKNLILLTYLCVGGWKLNNQITFSRQNQRFWCWCILWIYLYTSEGPALLAAGEQWARPPNGGENWLSLILVITIELSPAVRTGYGDRAASWPMFDQPDAIISDTVYHPPPPPPATSLLTRSYFHTDRELLVALRVRAISQ